MDRTIYCTFEVTVKATTDTDAASLRALASLITAAYFEAQPIDITTDGDMATHLADRTGQPVAVVITRVLHHWRADDVATATNKASTDAKAFNRQPTN